MMRSITDQTDQIDVSQEDAAKNIDYATTLGVGPDVFRASRESLAPLVDNAKYATQATPEVARTIAESKDHAAAIAPEAGIWSKIETAWNGFLTQQARMDQAQAQSAEAVAKGVQRFGESLPYQPELIRRSVAKSFGPEREKTDLNWRKLRGDNWTDADEARLDALRTSSDSNYGYSPLVANIGGEQVNLEEDPLLALPGAFAAGAVDIPMSANRNKKLVAGVIAADTATQAAIFGTVGGVAGLGGGAIPAAGAGALYGFRVGLGHAFVAAAVADAYRDTTANTFEYLERATGEGGRPLEMDMQTKKDIAYGVGLISGGVNLIAAKSALTNTPLLSKILGGQAGQLGNATLREAVIQIGRLVRTNAIAGGITEATRIVGEALGDTYDGSDVKLTNALKNVVADYETTGPRVLKAATTSAVVSTGIGLGLAGVEKLIPARINEATSGRVRTPGPRDVGASYGEPGQMRLQLEAGPSERIQSDVQPSVPPINQVDQVTKVADLMESTSKILDQTNISKLSPRVKNDLRGRILNNAGVKFFYITPESMKEFAGNNSEKMKMVNDLLDPTGAAQQAYEINAPVKVDATKVAAIVDSYPDVVDHVQMTPEGPSTRNAEAYLKSLSEASEKRMRLRAKLDEHQKQTAQERVAQTPLTSAMDDSQLKEVLRSKEGADAALARLNDEATSIEVPEKKVLPISGEPTQPSPEENRLTEIAQLKERITGMRDDLADEKTVQEVIQQALNTPLPTHEIAGEADYMLQPTYTQMARDILPEGEVAALENAVAQARRGVIDTMDALKEEEIQSVADVTEKIALEVERDRILDELANDPNQKLIEQFYTEGQKGFSELAINEKFLTPEQKEKWLSNPRLKEHRIFRKTGNVTPDLAVEFLRGQDSTITDPDSMFEVLAATPSRAEIIEAKLAVRRPLLRALIEAKTDLAPAQKERIESSYAKVAESHLAEADLLRNEKWGTFKKAVFKRIALPLPKVKELKLQAKDVVRQTKVGDLNPTVYKRGERASQRMAVDAAGKFDFEVAFTHKIAAALNAELTGETHLAIGKANKQIDFLKMLTTKDAQLTLKDAGLHEAMGELLDGINFSKSKKTREGYKALEKFARDQYQAGVGDFSMLSMDVRESINDYTVGELDAITDMAEAIYKEARSKNALSQEQQKALEVKNMTELAGKVREHLSKHINYDPKKTLVKEGGSTPTGTFIENMNNVGFVMDTMSYLLSELDEHKAGGLMQKTIGDQLYGVAGFEHQGLNALNKKRIEYKDWYKENIIKHIGEAEYNAMKVTFHDFPEISSDTLSNRLSSADIWMLMHNMGNEGNIQAVLDGFGISREGLQTIIEALPEKYAVAAQRNMDAMKELAPLLQAVHKRTRGKNLELVEGQPWSHGGKQYPGGYWKIVRRQKVSVDQQVRQNIERVRESESDVPVRMQGAYIADEMTQQGHAKARTESKIPIDLSIAPGVIYDTHAQDIYMREPIANALKILSFKPIADDIASVIGNKGLETLNNRIKMISNKNRLNEMERTSANKGFEALTSLRRAGYNGALILYKPKSILVQLESSVQTFHAMFENDPVRAGKSLLHAKDVGRAFLDPRNWEALEEKAMEIYPPLRDSKADLHGGAAMADLVPQDKFKNRKIQKLTNMKNAIVKGGFRALNTMDDIQKLYLPLVAYKTFMNGDAIGHPKEVVMALDPVERDKQAKSYVQAIMNQNTTSTTSLDRAVIQDISTVKDRVNFFNDARNKFNYLRKQFKQTSWDARRTYKAGKEGRYKDAAGHAFDATTRMTIMMGMSYLTLSINQMIYNKMKQLSGFDIQETDDDAGWGSTAVNVALSPLVSGAQSLPIVGDMVYAFDLTKLSGRKQKVTSVPQQAESDIVRMAVIASDFMDYYNGDQELSEQDRKAAGRVFSLVTGFPLNAFFDIADTVQANLPTVEFNKTMGESVQQRIEKFKEENPNLDPDLKAELDYVHEQLQKQNVKRDPQSEIPEGTYDIIGQIESRSGEITVNPNSSARGKYQFLEGTWVDIMARAPELNLTLDGRISSPEQQERAMKWSTEQNVKRLNEAGVPITIENLYAAHFLGPNGAVRILAADNDEKIVDLTSQKVIDQNNFNQNMSVSTFKSWVAKKVAKARRELDEGGLSQDLKAAASSPVDNQ